jgi:hypothetical protein
VDFSNADVLRRPRSPPQASRRCRRHRPAHRRDHGASLLQRATGERSARAIEDERLVGRIREVHAGNYCAYGYWRTWKARLTAQRVGRDRVKRLMRRRHPGRQASRQGPGGRLGRIHCPPAPGTWFGRDFIAPAPDRLWVADLRYLRCGEGVVFFDFVIDAYLDAAGETGSRMQIVDVVELQPALDRERAGFVDRETPVSRISNTKPLRADRAEGPCQSLSNVTAPA